MNPRVAFRAIAPCLLLAIVCCCGRAPGESPGTPPASEADRKIRESVVTEVTAALDQARAKLADLNKQLDDLAGQGKYVDVARVYWAALDWCVRDASRLLEAEELPLVEQARPLAAAILERLADPQQVLGRVLDQAPQEGDPLRSKENPFFQSVLAAVRPATQKEETWAKGRKGYLSIPNA